MLGGGAVVGAYRIEGLVGAGGMGVVYEATQLSLGRRVALKALRPELARDPAFVERFRREGRLQASFHHPHAIEVFEVLDVEEGLFIAMRLQRGPTLADLLYERAVDGPRALRLLGHVAGALDAAHAAGLVHRDVKPANVLVGTDDVASLGDFGLTTVGGDAGEATTTQPLLGTLAYVAPEVVHGEPATPAADRYAFAAMAYECLCGTVPFTHRTPAALLNAHAREPVPPAHGRRPELPPAAGDALASGLAKAPGDRPASASALVAALEAALAATALGPPPPAPTEATPLPAAEPATGALDRGVPEPRRRTLAVLAGVVAGVVLGAGAVALSGAGDGDAGAAVPAPPADARPLGSDLSRTGRTVDCAGRPPRPNSPECTVAQVDLPDGRVVIPEDGAILGWAVRGARGELALQVLRRQAGGWSQVARSQYEFVNNGAPHRFATNLDVSAGDVIALEVTRGGAFGLAARDGATTQRWLPTRRGKPPLAPDRGPGSGLDGEVLVRADYVPGGERVEPDALSGAAAAVAPTGRRVARRGLRFTNGSRVGLEVVEVGDAVWLDLIRRGRRVARMGLPDFRPGGRLITMFTTNYGDSEAAGEVGVEWVNGNSARVREHYYGVYPRDLEFYD